MNEINAKRLLFEVADILEDIGVEFFLKAGTLLGAVKEKKFMEADRVVDLAMLIENLIPVAKKIENRLVEKGMEVGIIDHRHKRPWDGSIYAFKIRGYGERCELAGYKEINGKRALPSHLNDYWEVVTAQLFEELDEIEFYGRMFKKPKDADAYLTEAYGDWQPPMTPSEYMSYRKSSNLTDYMCARLESWKDRQENNGS